MSAVLRRAATLTLVVGVLACGGGGGDRPAAPASPTPVVARDVLWETSLEAAEARAEAEGRPILVDFWVDWCVWCAVMAEEVYRDPAVTVLLDEELVPVRLESVDPALEERFGVGDYPTAVVVTATGDELARIEGYSGPRAVREALEAALASFSPPSPAPSPPP
jgi:thiol:disulfide interchange protein DsbD